MDPEVRRRAGRLLLGILACGVVIGLCVAALVFLLDRFTRPAQDEKGSSGDSSSMTSTAAPVTDRSGPGPRRLS